MTQRFQTTVPPLANIVGSVFNRTGDVVAASGDYNAGQITFTPHGFVSDIDTQAAINAVIDAIGSVGSAALLKANNLSDLANAATARTNLGLAIGTNVQAFDADLSALAALSGTNTIYYRSAANTWSPVSISTGLNFTSGVLSASGSVTIDDVVTHLEDGYGIDWDIIPAVGSTPLMIQPDRMVTYHVDTYASTVTMSLLWTVGEFHELTLAGNPTLQFSHFKTKKQARVRLIQDATGGRTVTWNIGTITWLTHRGLAPVLSAAPGDEDTIWLICTDDDHANSYANPKWIGWPMTTPRKSIVTDTASPPALTDNCLAYWKFDSNANSSIGSYNFTGLNGSYSYVTGKISNGVQMWDASASFDFSTPYTFTNLPRVGLPFTFAGWFKFSGVPTALDNLWSLLNVNSNAGEYNPEFRIGTDSSHRFQFKVVSATNDSVTVTASTAGAISASTWYFVVCRWNPVTKTARISVNGGAVDSAIGTGTYRDGSFSTGQIRVTGGYSAVHWIADESGCWNRELFAADIAALYNSGSGLTTPFGGTSGHMPSIDWSQADAATIALSNGSGTFEIDHTRLTPGAELYLGIDNTNGGSGSLVFGGDAVVDFGGSAAAGVPASGTLDLYHLRARSRTHIDAKLFQSGLTP